MTRQRPSKLSSPGAWQIETGFITVANFCSASLMSTMEANTANATISIPEDKLPDSQLPSDKAEPSLKLIPNDDEDGGAAQPLAKGKAADGEIDVDDDVALTFPQRVSCQLVSVLTV